MTPPPLPAWILNGFEHATKTECIEDAPCHNCDMFRTIEISWQALRKIHERIEWESDPGKPRIRDGGPIVVALFKSKDAMQRIEKIGEE